MGDTSISSSGGVDLFVFTALFHFPSPGVSFVQLSTSNSDHISLHSHGTPQGPKGSPVQCQPPGSFQQENTGSVMRGECTGLSQASPEPDRTGSSVGVEEVPNLGMVTKDLKALVRALCPAIVGTPLPISPVCHTQPHLCSQE